MKRYLALLAMVLLVSGFGFNCSEKTAAGDNTSATEDVTAANTSLENEMSAAMNIDFDDPNAFKTLNFDDSNVLYKEALAKDPNNMEANFGAAFTEMLSITYDSDVNASFDKWQARFDTVAPFEKPLGKAASFPMNRSILPTKLSDVQSPAGVFAKATVNLSVAAGTAPLQVSELQALVDAEVLPRINYAIERLEKIATNPAFTFIITPKMQGDVNADPIEIDLTEIYMVQAAAYSLKAICELATAYNFDVSDYDSAGMLNALDRSSAFLTLKTGGAARMATAKTALVTAISRVETGVAFLRNETDDQSNDAIKIGPDGPTSADLDSVLKYTSDATSLLGAGKAFTEDWDNDAATPEAALTISLGALFSNPVADFKALLPAYTVEIKSDTSDNYDYVDDQLTVQTTVTIPNDGWYNYSAYYNWNEWNNLPDSGTYSSLTIPAFDQKIDSLKRVIAAKPNLSSYYINMYWSSNGSLPAGPATIQGELNYNYEIATPYISYYPSLTWEAATFAAWQFPNPTINGLLPGQTDASLKSTFGIKEADWKKTM
jgi:hypothetical protein